MNKRTLIRSLASIGWLPVSQGFSVLVSLATFAVLSRLVEPSAYAQFAVLAFAYTLCALATDLSPMGYLLVHGDSEENRKAARRSALLSGVGGSLLLLIVLISLSLAPLPEGPPPVLQVATLIAGLVAQVALQPLRGRLMLRRQYGRIALTDVSSVLLGYGVAILLALVHPSVLVLCVQLSSTAVFKLVASSVASVGTGRLPRLDHRPTAQAPNPVRYGLNVLPISLAAYASRSLDSGVLPLILSPNAAASYARSYQLIITPITQVQLSLGGAILERMARARNAASDQGAAFHSVLWRALHAATFFAAVALSLGAPVIEDVFFGSEWEHVSLMIASMALLLPSLTLSTYIGWQLQLHANLRRSLTNLAMLLTVPFFAIVLGAIYDTTGAIIGLAVGALVQGLGQSLLHRRLIPVRLAVAWAQIVAEWLILAALVAFRLAGGAQ